MPRKAKDEKEKKVKKNNKTTKVEKTTKTKATTKASTVKKVTKKAPEKKSAAKKVATKAKSSAKAKTVAKKTVDKKVTTTKKAATTKKTSVAKKPATKKTATTKKVEPKTAKVKTPSTKKATAKKTTVKKDPTKKTTTAKKVASKTKTVTTKAKKTTKSSTIKKDTKKKATSSKATKTRKSKVSPVEVLEYYDLPFRYNKTIVKVLSQTPDTLFVYWDISDEDRENLTKQYGEFFFNDTKPVLIVHNDTMNYSYEIDINDFASSWYLHVNDSSCDYRVELGRRPINEYAKINDYLSISSSNETNSPNDHILFDTLQEEMKFMNMKNNSIELKEIYLALFNRLFNIKDFYRKMYKDENIDFERLNLRNMPSS